MEPTEFNSYNQEHGPEIQFQLPRIVSLSYKRARFTPPRLINIKSSLAKYKEALEITITTEKPIPARAATPVLYIGNLVVSHYEKGKKENEYIFYAFEFEQLKENEPIFWGWNNDPDSKLTNTRYFYKKP